MNLAIVTSCHNYGGYLREWAASIIAQTVKPAECVIVDNGSTDNSVRQAEAAALMLEAAGIPARLACIGRTDFGSARNAAVALASAEWVMHLDADDVLMPHCLADCAALAPDADVIALGYERSGDLAAGPKNRTRIYSATVGAQTLAASAPASGVSPFRRAFWQRKPYRTDMDGGWDTALWIGFAHMGARFKATRRPCFYYRQHGDSIFNSRRNNERRSAFVGAKLEVLRKGYAGVSVIVPWHGKSDERAAAWAWLARRYAALFPDWQIVQATYTAPEWRKGVALAAGLQRATGDVIIVADADVVIDPAALRQAVELVRGGAPWVVPHEIVRRLDADATAAVLALAPDVEIARVGGSLARPPYRGYAGGGLVVIERAKLEASGGIPAAFCGWGCEDEALAVILDTLCGLHHRLPFDLWHLWHPQGNRTREPEYQRNRRLLDTISAGAGDPDAMWAILRGGAAPGAAGRVLMVGVKQFRRGSRVIEPGDVFHASPDEARRHATRRERLAVRASTLMHEPRGMAAARVATTPPSFEDQRLAAANARRKGQTK